MSQRYLVCAVMVSAQGQKAELPESVKAPLMNQVCSTPFASELVDALNVLGMDARREQEASQADYVGIWITVADKPMLMQCQLEPLAVH